MPRKLKVSKAWDLGYDDGFNGRPARTPPVGTCVDCYNAGYYRGAVEREEVQRASSSNS